MTEGLELRVRPCVAALCAIAVNAACAAVWCAGIGFLPVIAVAGLAYNAIAIFGADVARQIELPAAEEIRGAVREKEEMRRARKRIEKWLKEYCRRPTPVKHAMFGAVAVAAFAAGQTVGTAPICWVLVNAMLIAVLTNEKREIGDEERPKDRTEQCMLKS